MEVPRNAILHLIQYTAPNALVTSSRKYTYIQIQISVFCRYSGVHPGTSRNISQDWHHFYQSSHSYASCFGRGWLEIAAYAAKKTCRDSSQWLLLSNSGKSSYSFRLMRCGGQIARRLQRHLRFVSGIS